MNELSSERIKELSQEGEEDYNTESIDSTVISQSETEKSKILNIDNIKNSLDKEIAKLPLYKLALIPVIDEEKLSLDDECDDEKFEILEKSKRRIIGGIATTSIIDRENEEISSQAIKKIFRHIEKLPDNYLNLMIQHDSVQIGTLLRHYKNRRMALMNDKIYVIAQIRDDIPIANKVWKEILSGELHSLSIKINIPEPLEKNIEEICENDVCWTRINDAKFLEVSIVETAANQECEKLDILNK